MFVMMELGIIMMKKEKSLVNKVGLRIFEVEYLYEE